MLGAGGELTEPRIEKGVYFRVGTSKGAEHQ